MVALSRRLLLFLWRSARLILGWAFIALGVLGVILPVLPGTIWLIIGALLIGRRSRILRRASVAGKRFLRRWAAHPHPVVGAVGRWALQSQRDTSRQLRRLDRWWQGYQRGWQRRLRGSSRAEVTPPPRP